MLCVYTYSFRHHFNVVAFHFTTYRPDSHYVGVMPLSVGSNVLDKNKSVSNHGCMWGSIANSVI